MAGNPGPPYAPSFDPGAAACNSNPTLMLSMSTADDPDAITMADSCRLSYKSNHPLYGNAGAESKKSASECCDTAISPRESQHILAAPQEPPTGPNSPGYIRMKTMASHILPMEKLIIFVLITVLATAHSLDNFLRVLYQFEITMAFQKNSVLGAVNTISTLSAATLTPLFSKSADVFGRPQTLLVSVVCYVAGTALQSNARNIHLFCTYTVFWLVGFSGVISMFEIIIADLTSMRWRVIMFYLPALPYLATVWISVSLNDTLVPACPWRKRFVWSAVIYAVVALPLLIALFIIEWRAKKRMPLPTVKAEFTKISVRRLAALRFRQMDIIGWIPFFGVVCCLIAPWAAVQLIGPQKEHLSIGRLIGTFGAGIFCLIVLYFVEKRAMYPIFSGQLLKEKRVLIALCMGFLYHMAYYAQHTYLYIGLIIRHDQGPDNAARITGLYTFTSTFFGLFMGAIISISRDLRWYLRFGAIFFLISFVVQIAKPTGISNATRMAGIGSQLLLGIAGGLFPFPAMAFIQGAREHAQLATLIGIYMTACRIGGGIGQALAGALWMNDLCPSLQKALAGLLPEELLDALIQMPSDLIEYYTWDTKTRRIIVDDFVRTHRYLCVVGTIATAFLVVLAFLIRDASLEGPPEDVGIELMPFSKNKEEPEEVPGPKATPGPLRPSRFPVIM